MQADAVHTRNLTETEPTKDDEPARTLAGSAYHRLRDEILSGALAPGEKLRFQVLKDRYGLSTGTIREALVRLHSEQLVLSEGHRGYWVAPISIDELRDLTRMRVLLEVEALRGSILRGGDEWEAGILSAFHRLARATERGAHLSEDTLPEWEIRHDEFHRALIAGDGSRLLFRLRCHLAQLVKRYRRYALAVAGDRPHLDEHRAIMEAALAHRAELAVGLLTEHYELTTQAILARFEDGDGERMDE